MFAYRRPLGHVALGLLLFGAQACEQSKTEISGGVPAGETGFEQTSFPLISTGCTVTSGTSITAFTLGAGESLYMYKRAADGQVVANANLGSTTAECAFPTTYRITVGNTASTNTHKVLFDFVGGTFGMATAATGGTGTNPGPNLVVTLTGTGNTVKMRGTANWESFVFGTTSGTSYGSINEGTATAVPATARTFPDLSMTGVQNIVVASSGGNDTITGQGGTPIGTGSSPLDGAIDFDVYGGDGNDTITSGAASTGVVSNNLYGNAGDDMFIQQVAKARDNIFGSDSGGAADSDTVDYSLRTNAVSATLGDDALVSISANAVITCAVQASMADHDSFSINDGTNPAVTYEYRKTAVVASTGSITTTAQTNYSDHDTLVLNDGVHTVTFEYAVSAASGTLTLATPGDTWIDISAASSANDVAVATYNAIHALTMFTIAATSPGATAVVALSNPAGYDEPVIGTAGGNTLAGMTGGGFTPTVGAIVINISGSTTATDVCTQTVSAITAGGPAGVAAAVSGSTAVVSITPGVVLKPTGAATTKLAGTNLAVVDFVSGSLFGANDGESGEGDSLDNSIENIVGGAGNDTLDASHSTLAAHVLVGMAGNDTLVGSGMADTLWGGVGDDTLKGGAGVDVINGGDGNDVLQGGAGSDTMDGGGLNCSVIPATQPVAPNAAVPATTSCTSAVAAKSAVTTISPGINTLDYSDRTAMQAVTVDLSNLGSTSLVTGVTGEKDIVALVGATGTPYSVQYLRGGAGNDTLTGDGNANIIWGGDGDDTISGGGANDALYGENGNDTIYGDAMMTLGTGQVAGDDFISGGAGANHLFGNAGNDLIDNTGGTLMGTIDCGLGDADIAMTSSHGDTTMACEQ